MEPEPADAEPQHVYDPNSPEELLEQAQANAQATVIATVAFLTERGIPVEEWAAALGRTFAKGWDEPEAWEAGEFMDAMLTNFRSLGAEVVSADLGPKRAEAVTVGFPDPELCALFGVDLAAVAQFNDAAGVIAAERGLTWSWERQAAGGATTYLAARAVDG